MQNLAEFYILLCYLMFYMLVFGLLAAPIAAVIYNSKWYDKHFGGSYVSEYTRRKYANK